MKSIIYSCSALVAIILLSCSQGNINLTNKISLSGEGWKMVSSTKVKEGGQVVSDTGYKTLNWYSVEVPTTVLRALVKDGVYPDPWIGLNNFRIPDASDEYNRKFNLAKYSYLADQNPWKDPYWFRKDFYLPEKSSGKKVWLNFDGINYRADVWLNGHKITNRESMAGMFLRFRYDISEFSLPGRKNSLAVLVHQVDHPGTPYPGAQFEIFGKTRGHATELFRDETLKFSGGWDCAPIVRDRNMGIYQDVFIESTGDVTIHDPFIVTKLPLPDTNKADIFIKTTLVNNGKEKISGELRARISLLDTIDFVTYRKVMGADMKEIVVSEKVNLEPGSTTEFSLDPGKFPELEITNPHLWWPNGYGKQYLHNLELTFVSSGAVSDRKSVMFGIRDVKNELVKVGPEYARTFIINGRKVFCKGGWLQPDAMLNYDRKRIFDEARLLAMANVNMVASEDAPSPPDDVLESYDKYGLMYWETFYQCYRMYPGDVTANNPDDHKLALREAQDIIKRYRNHPSLVIWCAANEVTVARDIYDPLREYVFSLDGSRPFIPTSSTAWDIEKLTPYIMKDLPLGTTDDGDPDYNWNPEKFYFDKILEVKLQTFRNELGVASVPVFSSLKKFIPKFNTNTSFKYFPLDSTWAEHGAWDDNNYAFRGYDNAIRTIYGKPVSVEDYAWKAQIVNANSYRAMYEAANHRMWDITSGVMLWKLNDCWPSVLWQLYDWYLCQNSAYYFSKSAMEPVHIQYNANSGKVSVINTDYREKRTVVAEAIVTGSGMEKIWNRSDTLSLDYNGYRELFKIPEGPGQPPVYFIRLKLHDLAGRIISENIYWMSSGKKTDFSSLCSMQKVPLEMVVKPVVADSEYRVAVTLKNASNSISFFNRIIITGGEKGEEVLPTFWDSNFITLFPGETRTINATVTKSDMKGMKPWVMVENNEKVNPVEAVF